MKIGLIADIHGNTVALDAVLAEINRAGVDRTVCLGDVAAGCPKPIETLDRIRQLDLPVITGNADEWLLEPEAADEPEKPLDWFSDIGIWASNQLSPAERDFVKSFDLTATFDLGSDHSLLCFHGSPESTTERLSATTPTETLDDLFAGYDTDVFAGGHTHIQLFRRYGDAIVLNPGSVGLPYAIDRATGRVYNRPEAEYAILTDSNGTLDVSLRRTSFDFEAVQEMVGESEMPHGDQWLDNWEPDF